MARPRTSVFVGISLDGFLARPDGTIDWLEPYGGEEHGYAAFIESVDALVIGRGTYDFVQKMLSDALPWPYTGKHCVVMTHNPIDAKHGERAFAGEPAALLAALEDLGVKHVYVDGGQVIRSFLAAGLIDDMTLSIAPELIGTGLPLFGGVQVAAGFELQSVGRFANGLAQLRYRAKR